MYHIQKATRSLQRVLNLTAARSGAHVAGKGLLNQKRHYRLVALHGHETAVTKDKEITLYIKVKQMHKIFSITQISFNYLTP